MATYAYQIIDSYGRVVMDSSKTTWNFLTYEYTPAYASTAIYVPGSSLCSEIKIIIQHANTNPLSQRTILPSTSYSSSTNKVLVSGGNVPALVTVLGR